jgi:hypothetical protein
VAPVDILSLPPPFAACHAAPTAALPLTLPGCRTSFPLFFFSVAYSKIEIERANGMNSWCFHGKDMMKCPLCNGDDITNTIMKQYEAVRKTGRTHFLYARDGHRGNKGALEEHAIANVLEKLSAKGVMAKYERNVRCEAVSCATGHTGFGVQVSQLS